MRDNTYTLEIADVFLYESASIAVLETFDGSQIRTTIDHGREANRLFDARERHVYAVLTNDGTVWEITASN